MAEQFAFDQAVRDSRAVDRDERLAPAPLEVDRARHQLLAGAALAAHQDHVYLVVADHPSDELVDFLDGRAMPDDLAASQLAVELLLHSFQLGGLRRGLGRARGRGHHQVEVFERLGQVIARPALERFDRVVHRAGRGDHDDGRRASLLARGRQHFEAAHAGHDDVNQGDVETPAAERLERGAAVGGFLDAPSLGLQPMAQDQADSRVVVGNKGADRAGPGRAAEILFRLIHWDSIVTVSPNAATAARPRILPAMRFPPGCEHLSRRPPTVRDRAVPPAA